MSHTHTHTSEQDDAHDKGDESGLPGDHGVPAHTQINHTMDFHGTRDKQTTHLKVKANTIPSTMTRSQTIGARIPTRPHPRLLYGLE